MFKLSRLLMIITSIVFAGSVFAAAHDADHATAATTTTHASTMNQHATDAKSDVKNSTKDKVNINTADAQTLAQLEGVGIKKAEAIVAYRKANGNFKSIQDFANVKGVGPSILEKNIHRLTV